MIKKSVIFALMAAGFLQAAQHRGAVRCSGLPIPGATITATQGDQKFATSTDDTGEYIFENLAPGLWKIQVEMVGFQPATQDVSVIESMPLIEFNLKLGSAAPPAPVAIARPAAAPAKPEPAAAAKPAAAPPARARQSAANGGDTNGRNGGFQQLSIAQTAQDEIQAAMSEPQPEAPSTELAQNANESFLVNGSLSQGLQDAQREDQFGMRNGMNPEEMRARFEQMRASGGFGGPGGPGGPGGEGMRGGGPPMMGGGGPPMMGGGGPSMRSGGGFSGRGGDRGRGGFDRSRGGSPFGNRSSRARDNIRGGASFSLRNSALDAKPYSLSGQDILKPSYAQSRFSVMLGGALTIPHVLKDNKTFFFLNYSGTRGKNGFDNNSTLPSALERGGDFSQSAIRGVPVSIFDNTSKLPFTNNIIPPSRINSASRALLPLFPLPNLIGAVQNYQIITSSIQNSNNFSVRLNRSATKKDRLSGSFSIQQSDSVNPQIFGFRDSNSGRGMSSDVSWNHSFKAGFYSNLRLAFSRNRSEGIPFFAYGTDWASELGILGTSRDPSTFGPPNISFTNFGSLTDGTPSRRASQTVSVSEGMVRVWKKNNFSFGGEYRRTLTNSIAQSNARGSLSFSGIASSVLDANGTPLAATGFDFADFLLGFPQSSSVRFGNADTYFRGHAITAYLNDDWRVASNFSINMGLRYELIPPLHEKYNRMANLDIKPGFAGVAVVTPLTIGPWGGIIPQQLVRADTNNVAPRIGIAWRPFPKKHIQVRSGYGWYYNGSVSNQAAFSLAQQPPFAKTGTQITSIDNPMMIQNAFVSVPANKISNTFAVDLNYRVGYAQTWNTSVQMDLPLSMVLDIGYIGTKGTRLDIRRLPNRAMPGSPLSAEERRLIGNATGFTFETSDGNSIFHAGNLRLSRRFRRGFAAQGFYTFGKSIDNSSTFGGSGNTVAQDDKDLRAERGLSSFDRRQTLNVSGMFTTSAGRGGAGSIIGGDSWVGKLIRDWTMTTSVTIRSGAPFTPQVLGNRSDQGGTGSIGSGRADATGLEMTTNTGFFNPLAFTLPPATRFGNAGRNTIPGPSTFALNGSIGRSIRLKETRRRIDIRLEANNLLNSVNISRIGTVVNSVSYGLALDAASMRSVTANVRLSF